MPAGTASRESGLPRALRKSPSQETQRARCPAQSRTRRPHIGREVEASERLSFGSTRTLDARLHSSRGGRLSCREDVHRSTQGGGAGRRAHVERRESRALPQAASKKLSCRLHGDVTTDWAPNLVLRVISPSVVQDVGKCHGRGVLGPTQAPQRRGRPALPDCQTRLFCELSSLIK
jgi:hypothetical protein